MTDLPSTSRAIDFNSDDEWKKYRRENGFGASEAASFFRDANPWRSAAEVVASKLSDEPEEEKPELKIRELLEDGIIRNYIWYREKAGEANVHVQRDVLRTIHFQTKTPHIFATPDAFSFDRVVEAKTSNSTPERWEDQGVPLAYQIQTQQQMQGTGLRLADLPVLFFGGNQLAFRVYQFSADDSFHALLVERLTAAWEIVLARRRGEDVPLPDAGPDDARILARWCPPVPLKVVQMSSGDLELAERWKARKAELSAYNKIVAGLDELVRTDKNALLSRMNGAEVATFQGSQLKLVSKLVQKKAYDVAESAYLDLKEGKPND